MTNPNSREIKVPQLGESVSEATVARWLKKTGEMVQGDQVVVELETDKVTMEVTAPASGILEDIQALEGSIVNVGAILGRIQLQENISASETIVPSSNSITTPTPIEMLQPGKLDIQGEELAPSVRKIVAENSLDPKALTGTGKGGRLTKSDVINSLNQSKESQTMPMTISGNASSSPSSISVEEREQRVPMTRLRQRIAERLKQAQNTAAILTTFNEVDMSAISALRNRYKETFEKKHGVKLGFMSFFVKAAIQALKEIPAINGEINGTDIIYKNYYDLSVAVSAPQGLVVPVIRDADLLNFAEVEKTIAALGQKAKEGKLSLDEMTGGTFTISNGGIFGSLMSTPILNPPQSGILGMHKIQDRPMAIDGRIEIRPMMYIALSYDHRLVDGREAVTFLVRIKENIENPERLMLDL